MKKYAKRSAVKLKTANKDGIPGTTKSISKYDKLITKNANRADKKRMRQQSKNEIQSIVSDTEELNNNSTQIKIRKGNATK